MEHFTFTLELVLILIAICAFFIRQEFALKNIADTLKEIEEHSSDSHKQIADQFANLSRHVTTEHKEIIGGVHRGNEVLAMIRGQREKEV